MIAPAPHCPRCNADAPTVGGLCSNCGERVDGRPPAHHPPAPSDLGHVTHAASKWEHLPAAARAQVISVLRDAVSDLVDDCDSRILDDARLGIAALEALGR